MEAELHPALELLSDLADELDEFDGDTALEFMLPTHPPERATQPHFLARAGSEGPTVWLSGTDIEGARPVRTCGALSRALDDAISEWRERDIAGVLVRVKDTDLALETLCPSVSPGASGQAVVSWSVSITSRRKTTRCSRRLDASGASKWGTDHDTAQTPLQLL